MSPHIWLPAIRAHTGTDIYTQRLAAGLERHGYQVTLHWLPQYLEPVAEWSLRLPAGGCDLVHVNSWLGVPASLPAATPAVLTFHTSVRDPLVLAAKSRLQKAYYRTIIDPREQRGVRRARVVSAVSATLAAAVQQEFGLTGVATLPGWVDLQLFKPATAPRRPGRFRWLYVGRWNAAKGADMLPWLAARFGDAAEICVVLGSGEPPPGSWPENLRFLPRRPGLAELYPQMDALLLPSRYEGLSLVALEAQACGLPVLAFATGGLQEAVLNGQTGWLAEPGDANALLAACQQLMDSPSQRQQFGQAARQHAGRYTEERCLRAVTEVYERALAI